MGWNLNEIIRGLLNWGIFLKRDHVIFKITRVLWILANLLRIYFKFQKKYGNLGKIVESQKLASVSSFAILLFCVCP